MVRKDVIKITTTVKFSFAPNPKELISREDFLNFALNMGKKINNLQFQTNSTKISKFELDKIIDAPLYTIKKINNHTLFKHNIQIKFELDGQVFYKGVDCYLPFTTKLSHTDLYQQTYTTKFLSRTRLVPYEYDNYCKWHKDELNALFSEDPEKFKKMLWSMLDQINEKASIELFDELTNSGQRMSVNPVLDFQKMVFEKESDNYIEVAYDFYLNKNSDVLDEKVNTNIQLLDYLLGNGVLNLDEKILIHVINNDNMISIFLDAMKFFKLI